jgi:UDP-3-O-[3-hydroxymyristoyl] N-acetylglucosamine deacetylase
MDLMPSAAGAAARPLARDLLAERRTSRLGVRSPLDLPRREATLAGGFALRGPGLHTGGRVTARVEPAAAGAGIVFHWPGSGGRTRVAADWRRRVPAVLCTALQARDGTVLRTVEHLLAALSAHRIDNAEVVLDGPELPILDGSALPWCEAILGAGRSVQGAPRRYLRVRRAVEVVGDDRAVRILPPDRPEDGLVIDVSLGLAGFGEMAWRGRVDPAGFRSELAPSRSFGRLKWALPAKLYGLATRRPLLRGATLRNTAAIVGGRVVGGMRLPAEPARHRALDLVGDLALAGLPILARVEARRPGHDLNHAALARLMRSTDAWTVESGDDLA